MTTTLSTYFTVVCLSYLLSGMLLAPLYIAAAAFRITIARTVVATSIGWGAVALVAAAVVVREVGG